MHYRVKKLMIDADQQTTGYNLLSEQGNLLLAGDLGLATEAKEGLREMRFTRPDGTLLATMKFPAGEDPSAAEWVGTDFAVIQDYAVYAIFTPRQQEDNTPILTLEAEGGNWLVLPRAEPPNSFALFGQLPDGYHTFDRTVEAELPPQVGRVVPAEEEVYHFNIELTARRWRQTSLVVLALVFLLDYLQ